MAASVIYRDRRALAFCLKLRLGRLRVKANIYNVDSIISHPKNNVEIRRDRRAPAFCLEVRLGRLRVEAHPSLVEWGSQRAGTMSADGWAATARHRRRRLAATRLYVQVHSPLG